MADRLAAATPHSASSRRSPRSIASSIVEIDDDGDGFHLGDRMGAGQGLPNLRDRAAALGAKLEIDSAPGKGTTVRATIPT